MRDYTLYIEDDRYSVPTLVLITAVDHAQAREAAANHLALSAHHLSVEVCFEGAPVANVRRPRREGGDPPTETARSASARSN